MESWQALRDGNLLLEWALNLMVLNVSTRKYHRRSVCPRATWRKRVATAPRQVGRFPALCGAVTKKMKAWLASDLSELDLLVIQIDGLHVGDHVLVAAIGRHGNGDKHVLAVVEGATENTVVVSTISSPGGSRRCRGCSSSMARRRSAKRSAHLRCIQRCQVHKGRNIIERLPLHLHASVKKALRAGTRTTQTRPSGSCATWPGLEHEDRASRAHPGGAGRDPHRHPPRPAARTPALARLHQHRRERARHGAPGQPRQTLEERRDGAHGPPPACWRPRKPSVASRPNASCPSSEMLSRNT